MNKFSKLISTVICTFYFALLGATTFAQSSTYGNEWINFSQSYFKFKIAQNGIYRIPFSVLEAQGLSSVSGSQFALFREGIEVPIYVSTNGVLGSGDYIEFYGAKADGKMDKELYVPATNQGNDEINIISDSAAYFLTYGPGVHARINLHANAAASPLPAEELFCTTSVIPTNDIRAYFSNGESHYKDFAFPNFYYSGKYDKGEGYAYNANYTITLAHELKKIYSANPNAVLSYSVLSNGKNAAAIFRIYANGQQVSMLPITTAYGMLSLSVPLNQAYIAAVTNVNYQLSVSNDISVLKSKIVYNRNFDFAGEDRLNFTVTGNNQPQLLNLLNLDAGSQNILYDFSLNSAYHLGTSSQVHLDPISGDRRLFFATTAETISQLKPVSFRNYSLSSNQGTYLILADKTFIDVPGGGVASYASYRQSVTGGSHDVLIVEANELYDQFAFGMDYHPLSIKRFLQFAKDNAAWAAKPEYLFIIGKGISYNKIDYYTQNRHLLQYPVVPTFGVPGSDNLFAEINNSNVPFLAIGRLSAYTNQEILDYLTKVIAYENALKVPAVPNLENSSWKKRALHVAGSQGLAEQAVFLSYLDYGKSIIEDTAIGAKVITAGVQNPDITVNTTAQIDSLIGSGLQYITYFGHASASGFDYNLNNPGSIHSSPKFPIFLAYGCDVARIFEPNNLKTISENYIHNANGGSIAMLACTNLGWTGYLNVYLSGLYKNIAKDNFGKTLGKQFLNNIAQLQAASPTNIYTAIHSQNFLLQGDPGLSVYSPSLPDYYVDSSLVKSIPDELNVGMSHFQLKVNVHNLGKGVNTEVRVRLEKTRANSTDVLYKDSVLVSVLNSKEVVFNVPVHKGVDTGWMDYTITVNPAQNPNEITFANNSVTVKRLFLAESLKPVYPGEYSIVYNQGLVLQAAAFNPFVGIQDYIIQIDTTEYFNSPFLQQFNITTSGDLVSVPLNFAMVDSTVYYWRTTVNRLVNGSYIWNKSSFVYLANGSSGWNQSHFFQYGKNSNPYLSIAEPDRKFRGVDFVKNLRVQARGYAYGGENDVLLNNQKVGFGTCVVGNGVSFVLFDPEFGLPVNHIPGKFPGSYGACDAGRSKQTEFVLNTPAQRKQAMDYLDSVKNNYYVMVKSNSWDGYPESFVADWLTDDPGGSNTLYHKFLELGLDFSFFTSRKSFIGFAQKGNPSFVPKLNYGSTPDALVNLDANIDLKIPGASMTSTKIGPVANWTNLLWSADTLNTDGGSNKTDVSVIGYANEVDSIGTLLFTTKNTDTAINGINANQYPYIRLKWWTEDSTKLSLPHLRYWRVLHSELPEIALRPQLYLDFKDTIDEAEKIGVKVAVQNLKSLGMDSVLVRFSIKDQNNATSYLSEKRFRPLGAHDTLLVSMDSILAAPFAGSNVLIVEVNPDGDQLEEVQFNNIGYLPFKVITQPLPIQLNSFNVQKNGKNGLLTWKVAQPAELSEFAIEKSADGKLFSTLATLKASENSHYQFLDEATFSGANYYRLIILAKNGSQTTSEVKYLVFANDKTEFRMHPNPFEHEIIIEEAPEGAVVNVFDLSGKLFWSQPYNGKLSIDTRTWVPGAYMVHICERNGNPIFVQKLIKRK
jgi:hypothetical protein